MASSKSISFFFNESLLENSGPDGDNSIISNDSISSLISVSP
jgi:hypothetical protein